MTHERIALTLVGGGGMLLHLPTALVSYHRADDHPGCWVWASGDRCFNVRETEAEIAALLGIGERSAIADPAAPKEHTWRDCNVRNKLPVTDCWCWHAGPERTHFPCPEMPADAQLTRDNEYEYEPSEAEIAAARLALIEATRTAYFDNVDNSPMRAALIAAAKVRAGR